MSQRTWHTYSKIMLPPPNTKCDVKPWEKEKEKKEKTKRVMEIRYETHTYQKGNGTRNKQETQRYALTISLPPTEKWEDNAGKRKIREKRKKGKKTGVYSIEYDVTYAIHFSGYMRPSRKVPLLNHFGSPSDNCGIIFAVQIYLGPCSAAHCSCHSW